MFAPIQPRLRPDIDWSDLWFAWRAPKSDYAASDARAAIAALWPDRSVVTALSVRSGLDLVLRALKLEPGDEVVMSAVNIETMAAVVKGHRLKLVPVDIEPDTLAPSPDAVRAAITDRTRVILIAHLFGARVDVSRYADLKAPSRLLIEDCAQGWSDRYRGSPDADVSLFSFGPIKRRTALGGAVMTLRDGDLAKSCAAIEAGYPRMSDGWYRARLFKYALLKALATPFLFGMALRIIEARTGGNPERALGGIARGFGDQPILPQVRSRPTAQMLALLHRRLAQPVSDDARRDAAKAVLERLPASIASLGAAAPDHGYWLVALQLSDPDRVRRALRDAGFDATRGTTSLRALASADAAPNANRMMRDVLYLPPPWEMDAATRERMTETILKAL